METSKNTLSNVCAMPAPTWHKLKMNHASLDLPANLEYKQNVTIEAKSCEIGSASAFDKAVAKLQAQIDAEHAQNEEDDRSVIAALDPGTAPDNLDVPALSKWEEVSAKQQVENNVAAAFACGLGREAEAWLNNAAAKNKKVIQSNAEIEKSHGVGFATVQVSGIAGAVSTCALDVVAKAHTTLNVLVVLDAPQAGSGMLGTLLRVFAGEGSTVNITAVHALENTWTVLDGTGIVAASGARVNISHKMLGGSKTYTALEADLRGAESEINIDTRYIAAGSELRDFNYIVHHRGKNTKSNINANGALMGTSSKTYRGTIDLVHGCKGAQGTENETVLLIDEGTHNKSIPVILCDEDEVSGNHGATIGHIAPEQLFYLQCRGLSKQAAEGLFATAVLEDAYINVNNEAARTGILKIAQQNSIPIQKVDE